LLTCALGIGFLVRFLVALVGEENKMRIAHQVRPGGVHDATGGAFEPPRHKWAAVDSGAHIALGVLRITAALASNPSSAKRHTTAERSNIVIFAGPARESDSATERRYRLS
jgi:hypothetical protein